MSNSVILQVDESTKGLMEEIQSGISASIEDGMREIKNKVDSVDDNTDMILRKFKNFDGLNSTVDQLRSLAEESKKFAAIVTPLENSVSEIKQDNKTHELSLGKVVSNIDSISEDIVQFGEKQNNFASDIKTQVQNVLTKIDSENVDAKNILSDILQKMTESESVHKEQFDNLNAFLKNVKSSLEEVQLQNTDRFNKLEKELHNVSNKQTYFSDKYERNESAHQTFEINTSVQIDEIKKSIEKLQASLDIVVNLVTTFWKKW